jgi:hypothetical protein
VYEVNPLKLILKLTFTRKSRSKPNRGKDLLSFKMTHLSYYLKIFMRSSRGLNSFVPGSAVGFPKGS